MKREAFIILTMCIIAIALGSFLFFFSIPPSIPVGEAASVTVLSEGTTAANMDIGKNYRITDGEQYEEVWALANGSSVAALPAVDFSSEEVLALFDGEHTTGGYGIAVMSVVDDAKTRTITIAHKTPAPGCVTTEAVTSPFELVKVSKTDLEIKRVDQTITVACN